MPDATGDLSGDFQKPKAVKVISNDQQLVNGYGSERVC